MPLFRRGGHRGFGCTDNAFYQDVRDTKNLPVENTVLSVRKAFKEGKADYVEIDAVPSGDGKIFVIHNVIPGDHFFKEGSIPADKLNKLPLSEIQKHPTGRFHNGQVAGMDEMLEEIAACDPKTLDWAVNIEIKGVQGSQQEYEQTNFLNDLADTVKHSALDPNRVLWSSFSLENIIRMSHLFPDASFGMLFAEKKDERKPIYADHQDDMRYQYLQFDPETVAEVMTLWKKYAHPKAKLRFMHPEIGTIDENMIDICAQNDLGINCWALFEKFDENRGDLYVATAAKAEACNVPFTAITDYLPEMQKLAV